MTQEIDTSSAVAQGSDGTAPARAGGRVLTVLILLLVLAEMLAVAVAHAFVMPQFVHAFEDFDSELPALTLLYMQLPTPLVLGVVSLWAVLLIVVEVAVRPFIPRALIHGLSLLLVSAAVILMIFALFVPMVRLIDSVQ